MLETGAHRRPDWRVLVANQEDRPPVEIRMPRLDELTREVSMRRIDLKEKRRNRRVAMDVPVEIEMKQTMGVFNGRLKDMSTGGIRIAVPEVTARLITGPIYVNLPVGPRRYRVEVEAIRQDADGVGGRFTNLDTHLSTLICRHVFTELRRAQSISIR